jgi:WXG100 family type VII secretion target
LRNSRISARKAAQFEQNSHVAGTPPWTGSQATAFGDVLVYPGGIMANWGYPVSGFDATPIELRVCGTMLADISREVRAEMDVVQGEMDALLGSGWQGRAAEGFAQGWEQWQAGANDVLAGLTAMARLLDATGQDYDSVDNTSAGTVQHSGEGL